MSVKTDFVLVQPAEMTAKEVVAAGAGVGIHLSPAHVHVIRSKARTKSARKPVAEILDWSDSENGLERDLMLVAVELGFSRSTQLLDEFRGEIRSRRAG